MHMKIQRYVIVWLVFFFAAAGCTRLADVNTLGERLSATENTDEMLRLAAELKSRGKNGIPGLLMALSCVSENSCWEVIDYGLLNICTTTLHELAKAGAYTDDEVPILIRTIEIQLYMPDTFITAETLSIITGVNPGYSREFVESYSGSETDEKARREKIEKWKQWWRANRSNLQGS
jgi:hypothetical protein